MSRVALKPDALTTEDYIDVLIEEAKYTPGKDYQRKIKYLFNLKKTARLVKRFTGYSFGRQDNDEDEDTPTKRNPSEDMRSTEATELEQPEAIDDEALEKKLSNIVENCAMSYYVEVEKKEDGSWYGKLKKAFNKLISKKPKPNK